MPITLDLMDKAFSKILEDGVKILDEEFMGKIFKPLQDKIPPFKDYMTFMFEERISRALVSTSNEEKVKPWKMLKTALFAPTRIDIIQTAEWCVDLGSIGSSTFRREFRDDTKATSSYQSPITSLLTDGKNCHFLFLKACKRVGKVGGC